MVNEYDKYKLLGIRMVGEWKVAEKNLAKIISTGCRKAAEFDSDRTAIRQTFNQKCDSLTL